MAEPLLLIVTSGLGKAKTVFLPREASYPSNNKLSAAGNPPKLLWAAPWVLAATLSSEAQGETAPNNFL